MHRACRPLLLSALLFTAFLLSGCETPIPQGIQQARAAMTANIQSEPPGNYYVGRRYFSRYYKFWGYIRRPGQPWSTAQLVMLNEHQKLAPDREQMTFGSDNNYEYRLTGFFTPDKVYEPASNAVYPEFVLQNYQLISTNPAPIFKSQFTGRGAAGVGSVTIEAPE